MNTTTPVRGRFAPSPTGPLHFGSLVAAVGSYLQARSQGGEWYLRIENIDPPREQPGASDGILRTLEAFQLHWDGEVTYQIQRLPAYEAALARLARDNHLFYCDCSRRQLREQQKSATPATPYPGHCRGQRTARPDCAVRIEVGQESVTVEDGCLGRHSWNLADEIGDFIVRRRDGLFAYHLAVVVDDADQGMTEIVRGNDLLDNTPQQIYLQRRLGLPTPRYLHLPVAVHEGLKLSKQTHAPALDLAHPGPLLYKALHFLGHTPPASLQHADPASLLQWALTHWQVARLPKQRNIEIGSQ